MPAASPKYALVSQLEAHLLTLPQLKFNPTNPYILYAAFRRRSEIYSWDLRGDVSTPLQILRPHEEQQALTNQKVQFDVDFSGRWLATGDQVLLSVSFLAMGLTVVVVVERDYLGFRLA